MPRSGFPPSRLPAGILVLLLALALAPMASAQAPSCEGSLAEAQQRYNNGQFEEVITLATECLESEASTAEERQQAHRLIGLSYIGQDLRDDARAAVRRLIELVPNFEPNPVTDPPQFIEMIDEVRRAQQAEAAQEPAQEAAVPEAEDPQVAEAMRRAEEERLAEEARQAEAARRAEEQRRAQAQQEKRGGGLTKWLLLGGAVVGGGVLAAVLLTGGEDGGGGGAGGIPTPPGPPGR